MLSVADIDRTRRFYEDMLGFVVDNTFEVGGQTVWCHMSLGPAMMMFTRQREAPSDEQIDGRKFQVYYLYPDDVSMLHRRMKSAGAAVSDLRVTIYRMKEFDLVDPDGYRLLFGQETDEPCTVRE